MQNSYTTKVIKIGNSKGIRIPHPILEQTGLNGEVELIVEGRKLIIRASSKPRKGWGKQFIAMSAAGDDQLLDSFTPTDFDEDEWEW